MLRRPEEVGGWDKVLRVRSFQGSSGCPGLERRPCKEGGLMWGFIEGC